MTWVFSPGTNDKARFLQAAADLFQKRVIAR
jgi:hypothetical protein